MINTRTPIASQKTDWKVTLAPIPFHQVFEEQHQIQKSITTNTKQRENDNESTKEIEKVENKNGWKRKVWLKKENICS